MTIYKIEYETKDQDGDVITLSDLDDAFQVFEEITTEGATTSATLTEYYIYGGICQGDKLLKEYKQK